eukprot:TRINITY_DN3176_c0_g1_i4.p1 TRINITY_DN3176_c0_g1~~TRINITY_DN3176_c0_g1_i4.p1  ORF type:complete len:224 (-),score=28.74 TRINITY_DN3176_c0_g1_i4:190-861(-)
MVKRKFGGMKCPHSKCKSHEDGTLLAPGSLPSHYTRQHKAECDVFCEICNQKNNTAKEDRNTKRKLLKQAKKNKYHAHKDKLQQAAIERVEKDLTELLSRLTRTEPARDGDAEGRATTHVQGDKMASSDTDGDGSSPLQRAATEPMLGRAVEDAGPSNPPPLPRSHSAPEPRETADGPDLVGLCHELRRNNDALKRERDRLQKQVQQKSRPVQPAVVEKNAHL